MLRVEDPQIGIDFEIVSGAKEAAILKPPRIEGNTEFQKRAFRIVSDCLGRDLPSNSVSEIGRKCFPLVDYLVKPRSIDEFQDLKKAALDTLRKYGRTNDQTSPYYWMPFICGEFGIFPNVAETDYAANGDMSLKDVWKMYEQPGLARNGKIISINQARKLSESALNEEVRFGLVCGKFRMGKVHGGYENTFKKAKEVLGTAGMLLVVLDGDNILKARYGDHLASIDTQLRLKQVVDTPGVNFAAVAEGFKGMQTEDVPIYMNALWHKLRPHYYFLGSRRDELFPAFEKTSHKEGIILLWNEDGEVPSTSDVVRNLQGRM